MFFDLRVLVSKLADHGLELGVVLAEGVVLHGEGLLVVLALVEERLPLLNLLLQDGDLLLNPGLFFIPLPTVGSTPGDARGLK